MAGEYQSLEDFQARIVGKKCGACFQPLPGNLQILMRPFASGYLVAGQQWPQDLWVICPNPKCNAEVHFRALRIRRFQVTGQNEPSNTNRGKNKWNKNR